MAEQQTPMAGADTQRRAEAVSLLGLALQALLAGFLFLMHRRTGSEAALVEVAHAGAGVILWFALWMLSRQRRLVALEALEAEQLRRERQAAGLAGSSIFETQEEQFYLARRRLGWMTRWLMPFFTLVLAASMLSAGLLVRDWPLLPNLRADFWGQVRDADVGAGFVLGGAFVAFLLSRYASGLARIQTWQHLRAGASYLFSDALVLAALAVGLGLAHFEMPVPERALAVVIRLLMLLLGFELIVNLVLGFYRPRLAGEVPQPAFDSRFLALFSETASIARSIAEAINYQFGFDVSKTWFYKLMERSIAPLLYFGAFCLIGITSLVVVDSGEEAVIERWGRPVHDRPLTAGLKLKYPWPIEGVQRFDVRRARRLTLGFVDAPAENERAPGDRSPPLILWTNLEHGVSEEADLLVATPRGEGETGGGRGGAEDPRGRSVPVSILRAVAEIEYHVEDMYDYGYRHRDAHTLLRSVAQRELVRYAASVDQGTFLSGGRAEAARLIRERIQARAQALRLGVRVTLVTFTGVHPAQEVAEAYQAVVGAEQDREASKQEAQRQRTEALTRAVGDTRLAVELAAAVRRAEELSQARPVDSVALAEAERKRDELMTRASGQVAQILAGAHAERARRINQAKGNVDEYRMQLVSYRAAPTYYAWTKYFETLKEGLPKARRYLVACETEGRRLLLILNTEEQERLRFR